MEEKSLVYSMKLNICLIFSGHDVVARFMLNKSASFLSDSKWQLENDIFDEIPFSNTKVLLKALGSFNFKYAAMFHSLS